MSECQQQQLVWHRKCIKILSASDIVKCIDNIERNFDLYVLPIRSTVENELRNIINWEWELNFRYFVLFIKKNIISWNAETIEIITRTINDSPLDEKRSKKLWGKKHSKKSWEKNTQKNYAEKNVPKYYGEKNGHENHGEKNVVNENND